MGSINNPGGLVVNFLRVNIFYACMGMEEVGKMGKGEWESFLGPEDSATTCKLQRISTGAKAQKTNSKIKNPAIR